MPAPRVSGESLGGDDEKRCFRIQMALGFEQLRAVYVGNKVKFYIGAMVIKQCFGHHGRAQIGSSYADVTTSVMALPLYPRHSPLRTSSENLRMR